MIVNWNYYRLSQACSHIGGLLFALAHGQATKVEESCTSNLCMWKVPRNQAKAQPLSSFQLAKPRVTPNSLTPNTVQPPPQSTFDPRHSEDRYCDLHNSLKELRKLKEIFPQTGRYAIVKKWFVAFNELTANHCKNLLNGIVKLEKKLQYKNMYHQFSFLIF